MQNTNVFLFFAFFKLAKKFYIVFDMQRKKHQIFSSCTKLHVKNCADAKKYQNYIRKLTILSVYQKVKNLNVGKNARLFLKISQLIATLNKIVACEIRFSRKIKLYFVMRKTFLFT